MTTTDTFENEDVKEAAIIEAARKTFLARGFDGASMDSIALAANVSKRTVYNRFRSKEDLFTAAIDETCRRILPVDIMSIEANLPAEDFLETMLRRFLEGILEPEAIALRRIAAFESSRNPALGRAYLDHGPRWMVEQCAPLLERLGPRLSLNIADATEACWRLGALVSEPLFTNVLLGDRPDNLAAAIDHQLDRGLNAFYCIYRDA